MNGHSPLVRMQHNGLPVYIFPDVPDWFVPSTRTDIMLQAMLKHDTPAGALEEFCRQTGESPDRAAIDHVRLREVLGHNTNDPYQGRGAHLRLNSLREMWFHVTDTCNLSCRHCLFAASPAHKKFIPPEQLQSLIDQSRALGCGIFYFTGGEPLVYPEFVDILRHSLDTAPDSRAVVLTNGLLLREKITELTTLDTSRLYLQVSLDGLEKEHDYLRGQGAFARLRENLEAARQAGLNITVSIAVNSANIEQLPLIAEQAAHMGAHGLHLMYHFARGKGTDEQFVKPDILFGRIKQTAEVCADLGLTIDNLEVLRGQVFSMPYTRYDLSNMAWESLAVGADGEIYPSPALVGIEELACGSAAQGLEKVWRKSEVLAKIRQCSLLDSWECRNNPWKFIIGGNDPDHSYTRGHEFVGHDPYVDLYQQLSLHLIVEQARKYPDQGLFRLRMGDLRFDCPDVDDSGHDGTTRLTHCNCVVSLAGTDGYASVREFYGSAANRANQDIVNPFGPDAESTAFIPEQSTQRSYGCGSPVRDAAPRPGEVVVDLGSGSGVECFLAASMVGEQGKVYGIDMTDDMLGLAESSKNEVVAKLGYDNIEFKKGYLEDIPLPDNSADVVISNCVINLSPDKRRTYLEIFRVLKPGGRLVVADIITDNHVDPAIKNSAKLRGECLGGAMRQVDLTTMLDDCGFQGVFFHKRHPYRQLGDNYFFSLTYQANKSTAGGFLFEGVTKAVYRGPSRSLVTDRGVQLNRGNVVTLSSSEAALLGESVFLLDDKGAVTNIAQQACSCDIAPEQKDNLVEIAPAPTLPVQRHQSDCMACGGELHYNNEPRERTCHFCGIKERANAVCVNNHYICDTCHGRQGLEIIRHICLTTGETDVMALLQTIRKHPGVPMHGPEHHSLVPGVVLAAYRNSSGEIERKTIETGIERGKAIPGGTCGFWGTCGAAVGAGIAASLILDATPLTPGPRQNAQAFSAEVLAAVGEIRGARCCLRESWTALRKTVELSEKYFNVPLTSSVKVRCAQYDKNKECIRNRCPVLGPRKK